MVICKTEELGTNVAVEWNVPYAQEISPVKLAIFRASAIELWGMCCTYRTVVGHSADGGQAKAKLPTHRSATDQ